MAQAGYYGKVYLTESAGSGTSATDEACSNVSGKIYQVDDASKQMIDPTVSVTVKDNGSTVSAGDIDSIDYLFGKVTFDSGYTVTGPVTMSYTYLARTAIASARGFSYTRSRNLVDTTLFGGAYRQFTAGLFSVEGVINILDFADTTVDSQSISDILTAGTPLMLEMNTDSTAVTTKDSFRAYVLLNGVDISSDVDDVVQDDVSFTVVGVTSTDGYLVNFSEDTQ